jgi:transcriptional regulator with XRE-family HTH domain
MKEIFSQRLKRVRLEKGLTAVELGKRAKVSKQAIYNMEACLTLPSVEVFRSLAVALGVSLDYLAGLDETPPVVRPELPSWLRELLPGFEALDRAGQAAVKALVQALAKKG